MMRFFFYIKTLAKRIKSKMKIILLTTKYLRNKITEQRLIYDINKLGIKNGAVVFVHSSLSKIGYVDGGPSTVIKALKKVIGDNGTLVMPAFTIKGSMKETLEYYVKNDITFDYRDKEGGIGIISKTFCKEPDVCRSIHPTHSVCAWGKNASFITEGHENCDTNFGLDSPFYKLMELDSWILGLGVDLGPVTFYHVIEDMNKDFPLNPYCEKRYPVQVRLPNGGIKIMLIKAHSPDLVTRIDKAGGVWIRQFFENYLRKDSSLIEGKIGDAKSWLIKAKALYKNQEELVSQGVTIYTTKDQFENSKVREKNQQV